VQVWTLVCLTKPCSNPHGAPLVLFYGIRFAWDRAIRDNCGMPKPTHDEVKQLISDIILPFYAIQRDMLVAAAAAGQSRNENDAEHSWSVALLACSLAPHIDATLDIGLVSQFALVHDLVEVYADDTSVWADNDALDTKDNKEAQALARIQRDFSHFPWLIKTIKVYEKQDCNEALYVRSMDKYIAVCLRFMDGGEFFKKQGITKEIFDAKMAIHRQKAHGHAGAAAYYEESRKEYELHPEHFAVKPQTDLPL
jgi:5'-deoxynucleotidase YfbR-like HD superfamily hydrolase